MKKSELDTPCLVLDLDILEENLDKMQAGANAAGKNLRPHAKTHKCSTLARMQLAKGAVGVSVAKVSEAEGLVNAGVHGILITGALAVERKVARLVTLVRKSPTLMAVVDDPSNIALLARHLKREGLRMDVLLDIDVGSERTGVPPGRASELAELVLASDHLCLRGVQAYAGHVQHIHRYDERKEASMERLGRAVKVFEKLRAKEVSCTIFSGTGTGTSEIDLSVPAMTELQVGSYALMDAEYMALESVSSTGFTGRFRPALT
ncbi:MAG: alanine racemase, partial [Desulfobacterales bacterium]|nr:alanine racemase [Desulfobacterales bacterium]